MSLPSGYTGDSDFSTNHNFGEPVTSDTPIFLVDMDGVLVDLEGWMYEEWVYRYPLEPLIPREERQMFYMDLEHPPGYHDRLRDMMCEPGAFCKPLPVEGAVKGIHDLLNYGEVFICTSPMFSNPTCSQDKVWWVDHHLGPDWRNRVVITKDKTTVRGTWLFDDRPKVEGRLIPTWKHIVFHQPYNIQVDGLRANDWPHALSLVANEFG